VMSKTLFKMCLQVEGWAENSPEQDTIVPCLLRRTDEPHD
jgi:hypothetical protein